MRFNFDNDYKVVTFGLSDKFDHPAPFWMTWDNYFLFQYSGSGDISEITNWVQLDPPPVDNALLLEDRQRFGAGLVMEFLSGTANVSLTVSEYQAVTDAFYYAEIALRRGDIVQARAQLDAIPAFPPLWTTEAKGYFLGKIDAFLASS